ncbi:GNAT family N-acetyltransferase [Lentibacter sp.]|uniref:GNAT family N-acetyltransferase n=1 Tax=Lentibacter sp. TaxID=2024994 RepID=UPI003F6C7349
MELRALTGDTLAAALDDVARLRIEVFAAYPYLYDGDLAYERRYLEPYRAQDAIVVGAFEGAELVGAATGMPLAAHADDFAVAFEGTGIALEDVFYCAESVLLPEYRGQGIGHAFFEYRESHARRLGFDHAAFCAVLRPEDHPMKPEGYRPLDAFWRARGYAPLDGITAQFGWRDIGEEAESLKRLQVWMRAL